MRVRNYGNYAAVKLEGSSSRTENRDRAEIKVGDEIHRFEADGQVEDSFRLDLPGFIDNAWEADSFNPKRPPEGWREVESNHQNVRLFVTGDAPEELYSYDNENCLIGGQRVSITEPSHSAIPYVHKFETFRPAGPGPAVQTIKVGNGGHCEESIYVSPNDSGEVNINGVSFPHRDIPWYMQEPSGF